jgi:hypothetical protein
MSVLAETRLEDFLALPDEAWDQEARRRRYAKDPWAWVCEAVWTTDETDRVTPIKAFPVAVCVPCHRYLGGALEPACPQCGVPGRPLRYLREITETWHRKDPPILYVPKPRRMFLSWLMVSLHTWLCLFHEHAAVYIVSSKEAKSVELLDRAEGILRRIAPSIHRLPAWQRSGSPSPHLHIGTSRLWAVPEGADQMRQFTATAILADEIGTWQAPRATYAAMKPTIQGGGQLTLVSSAYPGFWRQAVEGELAS